MAFKFITITFAVLCFTYSESAKLHDLPPYITKCSRDDPKLNECMVKATEQVKPYLIKGIPELDIPSIEPYTVPEISLQQGTDSLNFKAKLTDVVIHGLSNYNFDKLDFDVPNLEFNLNGQVAPISLEGKYQVTGRVLVAPIEGSGTFTAGITHCNVTGYQKAQIIMKRNKEFLDPIDTKISIKVAGPKVKLEGLFDGDTNLNQATNQVINDNVEVLFEDLRPVIEKVVAEIAGSILKSLARNVPYDKLYPPAQ